MCKICGGPAKSARARYCISCAPRGKYNARKTVVDGEVFDSYGEAMRWKELQQLQRERKIIDLIRGKEKPLKIVLGPEKKHVCTYIPDYVYINPETMGMVFEDYKAVKTPIFNLKAKLVEAMWGIKIHLTGPVADRARKRRK